MKYIRLIAILLVSVMLLSAFAACNTDTDDQGTDAPQTTDAPTDKPTEKPTEDSGNNDNITDGDQLVVFGDGAYNVKVVRKEEANDDDKDAFALLRAVLKNAVGKMPPAATDFDADSATIPAIVIGKTTVPESVDLYNELKTGEAIAKYVNGKYVLAYTSVKGYVKLIEAVEAKVKAYVSAHPGNIVIDESWNVHLTAAEILGYDIGNLEHYIDLPLYNDRAFDKSDIDLGQTSVMHIASDTTLEEYNDFLIEMELVGFLPYTENQIGDNHYATYITEAQIVNVMYFANKGETRVTVDNTDEYGLPGLESDNIYKELTDPSLTVVGIGTSGYPGGMGYVYKLSNGEFFIVDGGITRDEQCSNKAECSAEWLYYTLQELADDPDNIVVAGWLLTHIHNDHLGAFIDMAKDTKYTDKITVKKVIYSQPNDEHLKHVGKEYRKVWMPDALKGWKPETVVKAHPGQKFYFADVTLTIYGSQDLVLPGTIDSHNNMSVVSKVEFMDKEFLYLADAEGIMNKQLETIYGSELKCDVLQAAHHGYNNTDADKVYGLADPMMVFWPLSTQEYNNCKIENISFNKRFFKNGVENYVAGETNMTFTDFYSWLPDDRWDPMPR
jgi:hypothetical protein